MCASENGAKVLLFFIPAKYLSTSVLSDKKHIEKRKIPWIIASVLSASTDTYFLECID